MQTGHELSLASVMEALYSFENRSRSIDSMVFRSREGRPDNALYYPTMGYGVDPNRTFSFNNLIAFTDIELGLYPTLGKWKIRVFHIEN